MEGKGEYGGINHHFLLFPACFQNPFPSGSFKGRWCGKGLTNLLGLGAKSVYQHFLLFPQCFQNFFQMTILPDNCLAKS